MNISILIEDKKLWNTFLDFYSRFSDKLNEVQQNHFSRHYDFVNSSNHVNYYKEKIITELELRKNIVNLMENYGLTMLDLFPVFKSEWKLSYFFVVYANSNEQELFKLLTRWDYSEYIFHAIGLLDPDYEKEIICEKIYFAYDEIEFWFRDLSETKGVDICV